MLTLVLTALALWFAVAIGLCVMFSLANKKVCTDQPHRGEAQAHVPQHQLGVLV